MGFHTPAAPRLSLPLVALLLSLGWSGAAQAQAQNALDLTAMPLEQLLTLEVYSASRYVQKSSEAPSSVTVISAAEIRLYGWRTLADIARSVRGLYVNYDRNYSYLGERGFLRPGDYNTRFLLQVDGNQINDAVYNQAPLGAEFPLDLALVERIEFVPGPGSSVYGSNAFFGVINVITKKTVDGAHAALGVELGQWGERKASVSASGRNLAGLGFALSASRYSNRGQDLYYPEFDTPQQNHGVAQQLDYERGERLFGRVDYGPLSLTLMQASRIKGVPTASFDQAFNDPRSRTTDEQTYLSAQYRDRLASGDEISARLFWGGYDSFGDYVAADRSLSKDGSNARWWGAELRLISRRLAGHTLMGGLELQQDYRLHQYTFDVAPYFEYLNDARSGRRAGLYLQDEVALNDQLLLNLGLRVDHASGQDTVSSPRAALIWHLERATTFKAIHGRAFRAPNSYEMHYAYPGAAGQLPNPQLAKEYITSNELALIRQISANARFTVTAFDNAIRGLITQVHDTSTDLSRFENASPARARGIEVEYEHSWASSASLRASASWTRIGAYSVGLPDPQSRLVAGAPIQANAPARLAKINAAAPLGASGWIGAAEMQYVGPRRTLGGATGGFWLLNTNLLTARLPVRGLEASVGIGNLLDRRYADPGAAEHVQAALGQDRRHAHVRLTYGF
jgi:outer membrane receptor protein involved in Fe transport